MRVGQGQTVHLGRSTQQAVNEYSLGCGCGEHQNGPRPSDAAPLKNCCAEVGQIGNGSDTEQSIEDGGRERQLPGIGLQVVAAPGIGLIAGDSSICGETSTPTTVVVGPASWVVARVARPVPVAMSRISWSGCGSRSSAARWVCQT